MSFELQGSFVTHHRQEIQEILKAYPLILGRGEHFGDPLLKGVVLMSEDREMVLKKESNGQSGREFFYIQTWIVSTLGSGNTY